MYHKTICEKALIAWNGKLRYPYEKARDRLRKLNKTRSFDQLIPIPELTFEEWNFRRIDSGIPIGKVNAYSGIPQGGVEELYDDSAEFQRKTLLKGEENKGNSGSTGDLFG